MIEPLFEEERYTADPRGNRVLYGLTLEETKEFEDLLRTYLADRTSKDGTRSYSTIEERDAARARRMALMDKHERAWMEVMGAQIALKHNPTIN